MRGEFTVAAVAVSRLDLCISPRFKNIVHQIYSFALTSPRFSSTFIALVLSFSPGVITFPTMHALQNLKALGQRFQVLLCAEACQHVCAKYDTAPLTILN